MIGGLGGIKSLGVAAIAFGRQPEAVELADGSHLVACIAIHHGVSANQGKPILVFIDVVNGNLPTISVMA